MNRRSHWAIQLDTCGFWISKSKPYDDIKHKFVAKEVMLKFMQGIYHCQCFLFNNGIVSLGIVE
jgi:hypothetical protein